MKAAYLNGPGGPEALIYGDLPDPKPGPGQVLVRMRATTVNHVDTVFRSGVRPYFKIVAPHVLGVEAAGEVAALGEGVTGFSVGERVVAGPKTGCYAELVLASADDVFKLPDSVSFEDGAGLGTTGPISWRSVVRVAQVQAGEAVLISAAASGTGSVMAQIAKACGAFVIGTAGGKRKLDMVRALGVDAVIDHYEEDVAARIKEITGGRGIDAAIDATCSGPLFNAMLEALRPGGRLAIYGNMASPELTMNVRAVFFKGLKLLGAPGGDPAQLAANEEADAVGLLRLAAEGKIKLLKDRVMPHSEAAEAHRLLEAHEPAGKMLLTI